MTPTITTAEMRNKLGNDEFDYILLCNKVCGVSHYNMKIKVVVEDEKDYIAWLEKQKTYVAPAEKEESSPTTDSTTVTTIVVPNNKVVAENK
jgi:cytochrome c oxidase subunit 2